MKKSETSSQSASGKKVVIVGGGASGMLAAITAARNGAKVVILEHKDRIGKKILSTGNGRCNFTNTLQTPECYRSTDSAFPWSSYSKAFSNTLLVGISAWQSMPFGHMVSRRNTSKCSRRMSCWADSVRCFSVADAFGGLPYTGTYDIRERQGGARRAGAGLLERRSGLLAYGAHLGAGGAAPSSA